MKSLSKNKKIWVLIGIVIAIIILGLSIFGICCWKISKTKLRIEIINQDTAVLAVTEEGGSGCFYVPGELKHEDFKNITGFIFPVDETPKKILLNGEDITTELKHVYETTLLSFETWRRFTDGGSFMGYCSMSYCVEDVFARVRWNMNDSTITFIF